MSNRATDNEHQEETLIKVINPLDLQPRKIWQFVALQTDEKPLTRVLGSLTHTIEGEAPSEPRLGRSLVPGGKLAYNIGS